MKKIIFLLTLLCATMAFASGGEHGSANGAEEIPFAQIGWQAANLGILLVALFFFMKDSVIESFVNRQKEYQDRAEKTKSALRGAEAALMGIKAKLAQLEAGETASVAKAKLEADELKAATLKEAAVGAEKIKNDATLTIKNELNKAKAEINNQILNQAVAVAKKTLGDNQTPSSAQEVAFVKQLEQVKA